MSFLKHQKTEALLASQKRKSSITKMSSFSLAIEDTAWKGTRGVIAQQQGNGALRLPLVTVRDYFTFTLQSSDVIRIRSFLPADSAVVLNRMLKVLLSALVSVSKSKLASCKPARYELEQPPLPTKSTPIKKDHSATNQCSIGKGSSPFWGKKCQQMSALLCIYTRVVLILKLWKTIREPC